MAFLSFLFWRNKKSANLAKQRLQLILTQERSARGGGSWPEYLPTLQRELLVVVSRYAKVPAKDIHVSFERQRNGQVIELKINLAQPARA